MMDKNKMNNLSYVSKYTYNKLHRIKCLVKKLVDYIIIYMNLKLNIYNDIDILIK